jgi:hypothetical protein
LQRLKRASQQGAQDLAAVPPAAGRRESAVHGIGSADSLRSLRAQAKAAGKTAPKLLGRRPASAAGPVWDARVNAYTLPFPGEPPPLTLLTCGPLP